MEEIELSEQCRLGNNRARKELYEQYAGRMLGICLRYTGDREMCIRDRSSITLLKNENSILPLSKMINKVAVIGPNADNRYNMLGDYTAPQEDSNVKTVLDGIITKLSPSRVEYVRGCAIPVSYTHLGLVSYWRMNEGEGTTFYDLSPSKRDISYKNGITIDWTYDDTNKCLE